MTAPPEPTTADVERVAVWMVKVLSEDIDDWEWLTESEHCDWRRVSRAAIAAGLDPRRVP